MSCGYLFYSIPHSTVMVRVELCCVEFAEPITCTVYLPAGVPLTEVVTVLFVDPLLHAAAKKQAPTIRTERT